VVGVIYLNDALYAYTSRELIQQIRYAHQDPSVRAVVLVLDSPGGTVVDTEAVYLELARLRETRPVVTLIQGLGASGAYYLSVGTDYIVAGPNASVGNVGVIATLPPAPVVFEDTVSTGPYKLWGSTRDSVLREIDAILQGFYEAVRLGRGERLSIPRERLLRGEIFLAGEALRLGLVDALGSQSTAFEEAARRAGVANYDVADLRELAGLPEQIAYPFFIETPEGALTGMPRSAGLYMLYVPPGAGGRP
jgi:protease-4